jgi:hypothetical protein
VPQRPPAYLPPVTDDKVVARFTSRLSMPGNDACWFWWGHVSEKGYGQFWMSGRAHWAHRVAYAIWVGEIPAGMTPDHTCGRASCVNPHHLTLVTISENSSNRWKRQREGCPSRDESYTPEQGNSTC